jgi:ligand-binding sensor domain-containing protein
MKNIFRFVRCAGFLFVVICLFTIINPLHAQWVQTNGPYGGYVYAFAVSGTNLFAGTDEGGVFISTNNGTSWTAASTGLTNATVQCFAVSGTNIFAGTWDGVYLSTNSGTSWTAVNTGLTNTSVQALAVSGTNIFAGTYGRGVYLSTNNGTSWTEVNSGLMDSLVWSLAVSGTDLFAGTLGSGVWRRPLSEMAGIINHKPQTESQKLSAFKVTVPTQSDLPPA